MCLLSNDCTDIDYFNACKELQDKYGIPTKTVYDNSQKWQVEKNTGHWQRQRGIAHTPYT